MYAVLHDNKIVIDSFKSPIKYGKDIESLFLYHLEFNTSLDLNKILYDFVHEPEDFAALKNAIKNQEKDRHLKSEGYYGSITKSITIKEEIVKILEHIEKYELYLNINSNLSHKPNSKSKKI